MTATAFGYKMSAEKAYSTDSNMLGATTKPRTWNTSTAASDRQPHHGRALLEGRRRGEGRRSEVTFEEGRPVALNGGIPRPGELILEANRVGGRHGLGMSDQIENRIIEEAKSRGIYEAPGLALLYIAYERLVTGIHNEDTIEQYRENGLQAGPPAVPGPLVRPPGHHAARNRPALGGPRRHRHRDHGTAPRQRLQPAQHREPQPDLRPRAPEHGKVEDAPFSPLDRIGQLTMRNQSLPGGSLVGFCLFRVWLGAGAPCDQSRFSNIRSYNAVLLNSLSAWTLQFRQ